MSVEAPARWLMHVDMDAFYAAVEVKEQPELKGRPVVVGGSGNRGVVCSASYEARIFGVRSATPMTQARRLCPQAVCLPPRFDLYQRDSRKLHEILKDITPLVEGIALDEAFLDITGSTALFGSPGRIAADVRARVQKELALTCSVGLGPNKLVAKLASKEAKPRATRQGVKPGPGTVLVAADEVLDFLWPLPVGALWGVGRAAQERLARLGVQTVGALAALPAASVVSALGKAAGQLVYELSWGRDDRQVEPDRPVKSIGHEETYPADVFDREQLKRRLVVMGDLVAARLRQHGFVAKTVVLKLRYDDFTTVSRSHTFPVPQSSGPSLWQMAAAMFDTLDLRNGIRLLGVTASGLLPVADAPGEQLQLDLVSEPGPREIDAVLSEGLASSSRPVPVTADARAWDRASRAMDAVRERFGDRAVGPATSFGEGERVHWPAGLSGHD